MRTAMSFTLLLCSLGCAREETPQAAAVAPVPPVATPVATPVPAEPPVIAEPPVTERPSEPLRRVAAPRPASGKPVATASPETFKEFAAAIQVGRAATRRKDYAAAIAGFDAALVVIPEHPRALSGRGYAALLAGDLAAAQRDLERAIEVGPPANIRAAIYFNLGLVAEKSNDERTAQRHFAESNRIRPSKAAAAKVAGQVCRASIGRRDTGAPRSVASWQALAGQIVGEAKRSEAAARAALCINAEDEDACAGKPPWHITVQDSDGGTLEALVTRDKTGLIFREIESWDYASRCGTSVDVELLAGDPLLVHQFSAVNIPAEVKVGEDGEVGDCPEDDEGCEEACLGAVEVYEEYLALDRATLQLKVAVSIRGEASQGEGDELQGGPKLSVRREANGLRVKGEGCDELTTFVAPAAAP